MKINLLIRFMSIGVLHSFLYLWLIPYIIYPRFGHNGFVLSVAVAGLISVSILGTLFLGRKRNNNLNSDSGVNTDK